MGNMCLAATGGVLPWVAAVVAVVIILAGVGFVLRDRSMRRTAGTALLLAVLVGAVGTVGVASPAQAAGGLGVGCSASGDATPPPPPLVQPGPPPVVGAVIGDFVWIDSDVNGLQDVGEQPAVGARLVLLDAISGLPVTTGADGGPISSTQVTDSNGRYSFEGLAAGSYLVELAATPDVVSEILAGEIPLSDVSFDAVILDSNGSEVRAISYPSVCAGAFAFALPGLGHTYTVEVGRGAFSAAEALTAGLSVAMPAAPDAGDDALDSDFDPDTRRTVTPIEVARGQRVTGIDLGILASVDEIPVNACR